MFVTQQTCTSLAKTQTESRRTENYIIGNENWNYIEVAIFTSHKTDFKPILVRKDKRAIILLKGTTQSRLYNDYKIYGPNVDIQNFKNIQVEIIGQIGQDTTTVDDFQDLTLINRQATQTKTAPKSFEVNKRTQQTPTAYII